MSARRTFRGAASQQRSFRAHGGAVYHYEAGCWAKRDSPAVASHSLESFLAAAEGLFFHVAKENAQWEIERVLRTLCPVFESTPCDATLLEECCKYAKEKGLSRKSPQMGGATTRTGPRTSAYEPRSGSEMTLKRTRAANSGAHLSGIAAHRSRETGGSVSRIFTWAPNRKRESEKGKTTVTWQRDAIMMYQKRTANQAKR